MCTSTPVIHSSGKSTCLRTVFYFHDKRWKYVELKPKKENKLASVHHLLQMQKQQDAVPGARLASLTEGSVISH